MQTATRPQQQQSTAINALASNKIPLRSRLHPGMALPQIAGGKHSTLRAIDDQEEVEDLQDDQQAYHDQLAALSENADRPRGQPAKK